MLRAIGELFVLWLVICGWVVLFLAWRRGKKPDDDVDQDDRQGY